MRARLPRLLRVEPLAIGLWITEQARPCGVLALGPTARGSVAHYCANTIFFNPDLAREEGATSLLGVTIILAHEAGHRIQELYGRDPVMTSLQGPEAAIDRLELNADCWAGATMAALAVRGESPVNAKARGMAFYRSIASSPGHATPHRRAAAYAAGFTQGRQRCVETMP